VREVSLLYWQTPKRAMPREEWEQISADGAPPGVYVPNMSQADRERWKAKRIGGADRRVEVRKTLAGTQMLMVVRPDGSMRLSMNQGAQFTGRDFRDLITAYDEAVGDLNGD
jgi:hypothetical protein